MQYLLDADICIYFLKGKFNLIAKAEEVGYENCFVSEITIAELTYGAFYSNQIERNLENVSKTKDLFKVLPILDCLELFGKEKARLRREGNLIPDFDLLIGTTAVNNSMALVTNNEKHLNRIEGVVIENWVK